MLTAQQLETHNRCITGSKVASILGVSPFKSKFQLFAEMSGLVPREEISTERMRMGNYAERMMDEVVAGEYGWEVEPGPKDGKHHDKYPFLFGLNDRFKIENGNRAAVLEYKNIDSLQAKQWADGVPVYYETQNRFYSMLWDLPAICVALFGGNHVEKYELPRNQQVEDFILSECLKFWDDLQNMRAPEPDGKESTSEALAKLYPNSKLDLIDGDGSVEEMILKREVYAAVEKRAGERKEAYTNKIKQIMADHEGIITPAGYRATWRTTKGVLKFDEKAFEKDNPELYQKYLSIRPGYRRFLVSIPGKNKKALKAA